MGLILGSSGRWEYSEGRRLSKAPGAVFCIWAQKIGEKMQLLIGIVGGGLISWFITHLYYKKSEIKVPPWAEEIIDRLPEVSVTIASITCPHCGWHKSVEV
jgi:hypothetical protein